MNKHSISNLAVFSGGAIVEPFLPTANFVRPDFDRFLMYSRIFFDQRHYTNDGALVKQLEKRLAALHQVNHCVVVSSGFWALVLAVRCLALPGKTEIVMPSLAYHHMADVAAWTGLTPHYCEVDPNSLAISADTAEAALNENTALILGVHPIVNCCDAEGLEELAARKRLPLLFHSVESVYETYKGRKIGSFGNAECFSLHASKLINGFEGGYITTNDLALADRLRKMRAFGFFGQDNVEELGMNAKLNEMHAAMALVSLDNLETQLEHNYKIYKAYQRGLDETLGLRLLTFDEADNCSYRNIVVELLDSWPLSQAQTVTVLHAENIVAHPCYSTALHQKKASYPVITGKLIETERMAERFMLLPNSFFVSETDVETVIDLLRLIRDNADEIKQRLAQ